MTFITVYGRVYCRFGRSQNAGVNSTCTLAPSPAASPCTRCRWPLGGMHARRLAKFAEATVGQLANLGRDALEPPLVIDHAVIDWDGVALLLVHIPEQAVKPAHRRGKSIEHAWVRSGGTTRKASRQEIGAMLMNSRRISHALWRNCRRARPAAVRGAAKKAFARHSPSRSL